MNKINNFIFNLIKRIVSLWVWPTLEGDAPQWESQPGVKQVLVLPARSWLDMLALAIACQRQGLAFPSSIRESRLYLRYSRLGVVSSDPDKLVGRIESLISHSQNDAKLKLQPVAVYWGRAPNRESSVLRIIFSSQNLDIIGPFQRLMASFINGSRVTVVVSPPLSVDELYQHDIPKELVARKIARVLRVHFRRERNALIGPDLSHRRELMRSLVQMPDVQAEIDKQQESGGSREKVEKQAYGYAKEMVSDYSYATVRFLQKVLKWFWNKIYSGVEVYGVERVKALAGGSSIVYLPSHRSHIDYLVLSYVLYSEGLAPPHIAAGINLNMPIVGKLLRGGGAFFIRRSFRDNPLYREIFNEYVYTLISKGFPLEFFIEGGRSRSGRMLSPKPGMLAQVVRSWQRNNEKPVALIPVYVSYEKVFEGGSYQSELAGGAKKKESVFDILRVFGELKKDFGKVSVNFGDPYVLDDKGSSSRTGGLLSSWQGDAGGLMPLAEEISCRINQAIVITPVHLVASVLLTSQGYALSQPLLLSRLQLLGEVVRLASDDSRAVSPQGNGESWLDYTGSLGYLSYHEDVMGLMVYLTEQNAAALSYFRNNMLHMLVLPSLVAISIVRLKRATTEEIYAICSALYPLLKQDFFLPWSSEEVGEQASIWINFMLENDFVNQHEGYYQEGERENELKGLSKHIEDTLIRYFIAGKVLIDAPEKQVPKKDYQTNCLALAQRFARIHGIQSPDFHDVRMFDSVLIVMRLSGDIVEDDGEIEIIRDFSSIMKRGESLLSSEVRRDLALSEVH